MRNIIVFLFLVLFSSCEEAIIRKVEELVNKKSAKTEGTKSNYKTYKIKLANALINLPNEFKEFNAKSIVDYLESPEESKEYIENLKSFESSKLGFVLFADTLNLSNQIMFFGQDYFLFDKQTSGQYLSLLERKLENEWTPQGIVFNRLESRFFSGNRVGILKIKYELNSSNEISFKTQYIISTQKKTFGILVTRLDSEDYQNLITSMKL